MKKMNLPDFLTPWLDRFYEPLKIVQEANKNGLMQSIETGLDKHGMITETLCN